MAISGLAGEGKRLVLRNAAQLERSLTLDGFGLFERGSRNPEASQFCQRCRSISSWTSLGKALSSMGTRGLARGKCLPFHCSSWGITFGSC